MNKPIFNLTTYRDYCGISLLPSIYISYFDYYCKEITFEFLFWSVTIQYKSKKFYKINERRDREDEKISDYFS